MIAERVKQMVLLAAVLLMVLYLTLNIGKLKMVSHQVDEFTDGIPAQLATLMSGNRVVGHEKVPMTGFFDAAGKHQLNFIHADDQAWQAMAAAPEKSVLIWQGKAYRLEKYQGEPLYHAETPNRKLYVLHGHDADMVARILFLERSHAKLVEQCFPVELCRSLKIVAANWGVAEGPFNDNELVPFRRGLPRGRWLFGPETKVTFQTDRSMKVAILVNLLETTSDQEVTFDGPGLQTKSLRSSTTLAELGGKKYFPKSGILELQLKQGRNDLVIRFSKWGLPAEQRALRDLPYAALLTDMKIKEIKS